MDKLARSPQRELKQIVRRIVEAYAPDKIILYGSYAYGTPGPDSDIDLLIIKETAEPPRERWFTVCDALWSLPTASPVEPLVVTQAELAGRLQLGDQFFQEIVSRGKTLYDRQRLARSRRVVHLRLSRSESRPSLARRSG